VVQGQPRQKLNKTPFQQNNPGVVLQCCTLVVPGTQEAWGGGSRSEAGSGQQKEVQSGEPQYGFQGLPHRNLTD
jgi:hypothetical protein